MTPNAGETEKRRGKRGRGVARNLIAASLIGLAANYTSVAHLNKLPERPSSPTAGYLNESQTKTKQRAEKRLHGHNGPKIPPRTTASSNPGQNIRPAEARVPKPNHNTHHLYSSGRGQTENISYSPYTNVSPAQRQAILGKPVEKQALETFNSSVARMVKKASPADLVHLADLDFDKIKNPAISGLLKNVSFTEDQQIASMLLADKISTLIESYQGKFGQSFKQDLSKTVNSFKEEFGQDILFGLNISMLAGLLGTVVPNINLADFRKRGKNLAAGVLLLATACGTAIEPLITPLPSTVPPSTPVPSPTPQTVDLSPAVDVTPTTDAKIDQTLPSDFSDIYYGTSPLYGISGINNGRIVGGISEDDVRNNNPGFNVPIRGGVGECRTNVLYSKNHPDLPAGIQIDQEWLKTVFNAVTGKNGEVTGVLPDGTQVQLVDNFWMIKQNGEKLFLNPIVASIVEHPFGYPCLVQDGSGKFFIGTIDENGALVMGAKFEPAFKSAGDIAKIFGYSEDLNNIASIGYDKQGNLIVRDASGNILSYLSYLNPSLLPTAVPTPVSTLAPTLAPAPTPIEMSTPTPEAAPTMEVNLDTVEVIPLYGPSTRGLEAKYRDIDLSYGHFIELNKEAGFDTSLYPYSYKGPSAEHELPYVSVIFIDAHRELSPAGSNFAAFTIGVFGPKGLKIIDGVLTNAYNSLESYPDILSHPVAGVRWNSTDPVSLQSPQLVRNTTQFVDVNAIINNVPALRGHLMMISLAKLANTDEKAEDNLVRYFAGEPDIMAPPPFTSKDSKDSNSFQAGGYGFAVSEDIFEAILYKP